MSKETQSTQDAPRQDRRAFLKKAGTAAATAPAVALLLTAHSRHAAAGFENQDDVIDDVVVDVYGRGDIIGPDDIGSQQ